MSTTKITLDPSLLPRSQEALISVISFTELSATEVFRELQATQEPKVSAPEQLGLVSGLKQLQTKLADLCRQVLVSALALD
jgi:hypothetical protein